MNNSRLFTELLRRRCQDTECRLFAVEVVVLDVYNYTCLSSGTVFSRSASSCLPRTCVHVCVRMSSILFGGRRDVAFIKKGRQHYVMSGRA